MEAILDIITQFGLAATLTFIISLLTVYFTYSIYEFDYWKKQGIPGERPWPVLGTVRPHYLYKPFHEIDQRGHKKFGKFFGGYEGPDAVLFVNDPEIIKQVLVKDFSSFTDRRVAEGALKDKLFGNMLSVMQGDHWKATRTILTPTFSTGKIKQMTALVEDCIKELTKHLNKNAEDKKPTDMKAYFASFSLDVIASCAFGMKTNSLEDPKSEFVTKVRSAFHLPSIIPILNLLFPKLFRLILFPMKFLGENPFKFFDDVAGSMIDARKAKKSQPRKDFLDILLEAEQEEVGEGASENIEQTATKKKKILTRDVMTANCILFMLAGNETTSTTLTFLSYSLATNPEIQEKLIQEIDNVMEDCKGNLTYEKVVGMEYLDMALSETLRMYPPGIRLERKCVVDGWKLGDINMKKNSVVTIPTYSLHHDEEFYPDPESFDPERFSPENKSARNPYTYLPFGIGPRNCIAMRFAMIEMKFTMAHLLSIFRFRVCQETEVPIQLKTNGPFTLEPKSVILLLEKRSDQPQFDI